MKLTVRDTILVTAIRTTPLQPREEVEVSDADGQRLLKSHPGFFAETAGEASDSAPVTPQPVPQEDGPHAQDKQEGPDGPLEDAPKTASRARKTKA